MSDLLTRLRARSWRLTPQRRAIAEVFAGEHVHLTADEVLAAARERLPEVSLATVYNTLNELVALGELREVPGDGAARRYDPNVADAHDHLVCVGCERMLDVHPPRRPTLPEHQRHGFAVHGLDMTFRGLCPECRGARDTPGASHQEAEALEPPAL